MPEQNDILSKYVIDVLARVFTILEKDKVRVKKVTVSPNDGTLIKWCGDKHKNKDDIFKPPTEELLKKEHCLGTLFDAELYTKNGMDGILLESSPGLKRRVLVQDLFTTLDDFSWQDL